MPCRSDYLEPNPQEIELSRVLCLLRELAGEKWKASWWRGYHPRVYSRLWEWSETKADNVVDSLCSSLKKKDVSKFSLEMQMWWRDHQKADAERRLELKEQTSKRAKREAALAKLTKEERDLLGLK